MKKVCMSFLVAVVGCFLLVNNASASPYQVGVGDTIKLVDYNHQVNAGLMTFEINGNSNDYWGSFCLEFNETTYVGRAYTIDQIVDGSSYWAADSMGAQNWNEIAWLYHSWDQGTLDETLGFSATQSGLQWAFWNLNGDQSTMQYASSAYVSAAQAAVSNGWLSTGKVMLAVNDGQDLLVSSQQPVPEPATMLLLGTGLVGIAGVSRRKLKRV